MKIRLRASIGTFKCWNNLLVSKRVFGLIFIVDFVSYD